MLEMEIPYELWLLLLRAMVAIEELQFQGRVELQNIRVAPARVITSCGGTMGDIRNKGNCNLQQQCHLGPMT